MRRFQLAAALLMTTAALTACSSAGAAIRETTAGDAATATQAETSGNSESAGQAEGTAAEPVVNSATGAADTVGSNILIVYFTMPEPDGVDTVAGASRVVVDEELFGNNQYLATLIQEYTGGDLFRIETVQQYPGQHSQLVDFAAVEQEEGARPELLAQVQNLDSYDVIFLGYPNWWADLPMPLYSFLEQHDLSGKTVIPFNCHGGSRFSGTIETISEIQPGAEVITDGFTVSRESVGSARADLEAWLQQLGYGQ